MSDFLRGVEEEWDNLIVPQKTKTYCINLARRADRWARQVDACALVPELDLRRVEAVDSRTLAEVDLDHWISPSAGDATYIRQVSRLAVWLSHRLVWEKFAGSDHGDFALVLEDDAVFVPNFFALLEENVARLSQHVLPSSADLASHPFDVLLLGPYAVLRSADGSLVSFEGTHAYLLSRTGASRLLALTAPGFLCSAIDWALAEWASSSRLRLHIVPRIVRQQRLLSGSDVSNYRSCSYRGLSTSAPYLAPNLAQVAELAHTRVTSLVPAITPACPSLAPRLEDLCLCLADLIPAVSTLTASSATHRILVEKRAREFLELAQDQAALFHLHVLTAPEYAALSTDTVASVVSIVDALSAVLRPPPPLLTSGSLSLAAIEGAKGDLRSPLVWDSCTVATIFGQLSAANSPWIFAQDLIAQAGERQYLLLCFSSAGAWHEYHDAFTMLRSEQPNARMWVTTEQLPEAMRSNKGVLALVEWHSGRIIAARQLAMPQGVWVDAHTLLVGRRLCHDVLALGLSSRSAAPQCFSHPLMANVHTIERCPFEADREVYLLSSADSDALFEVSETGKVLWHWRGANHGYKSPTPPPEDYRPFTFHSLAHALHPNSAAYFSRTLLLVTFFHIHALAFLDRTTGAVTLLSMALSFPHAIRPARSQPTGSLVAFSVCNTRGGEVVLLNGNVDEIKRIKVPCLWIQDAIVSGNSAFVSCNMDVKRRLAADFNRLIEVDIRTGASLRTVTLGACSHLYASYVLSSAEAAVWGSAWQAEDARDDGIETAQQRLLFVAEKLWKIDLRHMVCLFLHGSRVRGLASAGSDWDFLAVVRGDAPLEQHYQSGPCKIDLTILSTATFIAELRAHHLWRLACLHSPASFVLRMEQSFSEAFTIDRDHILHAAVYHSLLHYNKAARVCALANSAAEGVASAKKKVFHALLLLCWAEDLARNGRVTDQRSANRHWDALQADTTSADWRTLHECWHSVVTQVLARVAQQCGRSSLADLPPQWAVSPPLAPVPLSIAPLYGDGARECLARLAEIKTASSEAVCLRLSVPLLTHTEYSDLQQCGGGGAILCAKNHQPICAPIWRADVALASGTRLFRLFYYDSQWKLACLLRPDATSEINIAQLYAAHSPCIAFWSAWRTSAHVLPRDVARSYCYSLQDDAALCLLSSTDLMTMERREEIGQATAPAGHYSRAGYPCVY